jgi:ribose-phosphate pyrophosphokinase
MKRYIITGRSNPALGGRIASALGETPVEQTVETFPDGELYVCIDANLNGSDVYVVQDTGPPAAENIVELMLQFEKKEIPVQTVSLDRLITGEIGKNK